MKLSTLSTLLYTNTIALIFAATAHGATPDTQGVLRNDDGSVAVVELAEATAACSAVGKHLLTIRELADRSSALGQCEVAEYGGVSDKSVLETRINIDGTNYRADGEYALVSVEGGPEFKWKYLTYDERTDATTEMIPNYNGYIWSSSAAQGAPYEQLVIQNGFIDAHTLPAAQFTQPKNAAICGDGVRVTLHWSRPTEQEQLEIFCAGLADSPSVQQCQ